MSVHLETAQNSTALLVDGSVSYARNEHVFSLAADVHRCKRSSSTARADSSWASLRSPTTSSTSSTTTCATRDRSACTARPCRCVGCDNERCEASSLAPASTDSTCSRTSSTAAGRSTPSSSTRTCRPPSTDTRSSKATAGSRPSCTSTAWTTRPSAQPG